jgi:regulator of ribonuclease activity A
VRALAAHPRRSEKGIHSGQIGLTVVFAGVVFREGEWLCADRDGIVVLPEAPGR